MWKVLPFIDITNDCFLPFNIDNNITLFSKKVIVKNTSDRQKLIYEGGMKIWEGTLDLLEYFKSHNCPKTIMELGCGHGLVSLYLAKKFNVQVYIQDYNLDVFENLLFSNFQKNSIEAKYYCGSWANLPLVPVDMIIGSDILYDTDQYIHLKRILYSAETT